MRTIRSILAFSHIAASAFLIAGCGSSTIHLSYQPLGRRIQAPPARVGVYYLEDRRPGWPANSPARTVAMVTAELPIAFNHQWEGDKHVSAFVAEALRSDLSAGGMKVAATAEFDRAIGPSGLAGVRAANVDRVVVGRINYFGWVQPGFAGLAFQSSMPTGKVFIDIDLLVFEPRTGAIRWASFVREKYDSQGSFGKSAGEIAPLLSQTLGAALAQVTSRKDFWTAVGADPPAPTSPALGPSAANAGGN
jgi:hypothetical protein